MPGLRGAALVKLLRSENDIREAYRERIRELGISHQTVDSIAGWADGYCSKIMCGMKNIGPQSRELMNGALGMAFVVVEDPEAKNRVQKRWAPRKRPLKTPLLASAISIDNEVPLVCEISSDLDQEIRKNRMRELGKRGGLKAAGKGGKKRMKTMGKRARQHAARHAARMRWSKSSETGT